MEIAADPENSVPGWLKVADKSRDFVRAAHNQPPPASPGAEYHWTLALLIYSPRALGDLVYEISDTSFAFRRFAQKLFNETEPGFGKGTIPFIKIVETPVLETMKGPTTQIIFAIEKWIPRPDVFIEAIRQRDEAAGKQPAGVASPGNAYAKATGAEQPATVPAVASSPSRDLDDEIPF